MKPYNPALHEPLTKTSWSSDQAQSYIRFIVQKTIESFERMHGWPLHPDIATSLYF